MKPDLFVNGDLDYLNRRISGEEPNSELSFSFEGRKRLASSILSLDLEHKVGRDEDEPEEAVPWMALSRLPELSLESLPIKLGKFPAWAQVRLGWGRFIERGPHFTGADLLDSPGQK